MPQGRKRALSYDLPDAFPCRMLCIRYRSSGPCRQCLSKPGIWIEPVTSACEADARCEVREVELHRDPSHALPGCGALTDGSPAFGLDAAILRAANSEMINAAATSPAAIHPSS